MKKRDYILRVRRSRKSYTLAYIFIIAIIAGLIYAYQKGFNMGWKVLLIAGATIFFTIKLTEVHRYKDWWAITESSIVQSLGIFSKNLRAIDFGSISDIDVDQSLYQRILNYGDVNIRLFQNETSIRVNNINKPENFLDIIQTTSSGKQRSPQSARKG